VGLIVTCLRGDTVDDVKQIGIQWGAFHEGGLMREYTLVTICGKKTRGCR